MSLNNNIKELQNIVLMLEEKTANGISPEVMGEINEALVSKGVETAETLEQVPQRIGEIQSYADGYDVGVVDGKQAEYDRFWDTYQNNGNRKDYAYGFSYEGWTDTTFRPKHNIAPTKAQYMFTASRIIDLIGCLEKCGVVIDFSKCTNFSYMMSNDCSIKHFPPVDIGGGASFQDGFRYAGNLESASLVNVKPKHTWPNAFTNCSSLVDITFSGTIGKTISFAQSSNLSAESVQNIIDCLADLTGATAQTLTLHAAVGAKLTQTQKDAISAKNWTLVY